MGKRPPTPRQLAWWRSARFREIGAGALRHFNSRQRFAVRCDATAKSTGRPCQRAAMQNGKCYYHGGKTPSGPDWHVPQYARKDRPGVMDRVHAKLAKHDKERQKRQRRVALMTDEERAEHEAWRKTHKPGSPGARARLRAERKAAAEFRAVMQRPPKPPSEEVLRLQRIAERLTRIEERAARLAARQAKPSQGAFS